MFINMCIVSIGKVGDQLKSNGNTRLRCTTLAADALAAHLRKEIRTRDFYFQEFFFLLAKATGIGKLHENYI